MGVAVLELREAGVQERTDQPIEAIGVESRFDDAGRRDVSFALVGDVAVILDQKRVDGAPSETRPSLESHEQLRFARGPRLERLAVGAGRRVGLGTAGFLRRRDRSQERREEEN
jgi:hypothetical protein